MLGTLSLEWKEVGLGEGRLKSAQSAIFAQSASPSMTVHYVDQNNDTVIL